MKKKSLFAAILAIMMMFAFVGCGGPSEPQTLEDYFNDHPDQKAELADTIAGTDGQGVLTLSSDITGNIFTVTGTMTQTYPESTMEPLAAAFDGQVDTLKEQMDPAKEQIANATGVNVEDITIRVVYCNGDGTEIWSKDF